MKRVIRIWKDESKIDPVLHGSGVVSLTVKTEKVDYRVETTLRELEEIVARLREEQEHRAIYSR
jgi:hypothetical protein